MKIVYGIIYKEITVTEQIIISKLDLKLNCLDGGKISFCVCFRYGEVMEVVIMYDQV